jgi:hypothetical protein
MRLHVRLVLSSESRQDTLTRPVCKKVGMIVPGEWMDGIEPCP